MTEQNRCGRPTARKEPCRGFLLRGFTSCETHLTAEERSRYDAERTKWDAFFRPLWERRAAMVNGVPTCWSWPVARTESAQALRSVAAGDSEDAEGLADEVLRTWQDGRCAVCGEKDRLVVDHDHATGLVRGLLCRRCNTLEGQDGREGTVFDRYRQLHPTRILGVRLRYWDPFTRAYAKPARW